MDYNPTPTGDDRFDEAIRGFNATSPYTQQPPHHPGPYGANPHIPAGSIPTKPGLTRRGKTALTIGALALAGGGLITWQHHADAAAANALKAKQIQLQQEQIDLQKQKALEKANKAAAKTQTAADQARQAKVDACVNRNSGLVGKQLGYRMGDVIDDCQKQYPDTANSTGNDMKEAATATSTGGSGGEGLLIGAGIVLVGGFWVVIRKASRPQTAQAGPAPYPHPYPYPTYPHS